MPGLDRTRRRTGHRPLVVAAALALAVPGCSGSGGDEADDATTTTSAAAATTTAPPAPELGPAVEPTAVPEGYRPLRAPGIGVGVAVPEAWTITDLQGDDLTDAQAEAAATDPQLSGLLADGGALLEQARALAAIGPAGDTGTPVVTLIQLAVAVDEVPDDVLAGVREQVEGYGATDVAVDQVEVVGLPAGRRALRVRAVLTVGGVAQQLQAIIVPATPGLAVITVRDGGDALPSVVGSLAAS